MKTELYDAMFRRKSFHLFRGVGSVPMTEEDLAAIGEAYPKFEPLLPEIRTQIRIVPAEQVHFMHGAEYCILLYSEKKENYLMNAGFLGEQLDLWLVSRGIGSLWCGLGKPDLDTYNELDYVIMFAVRRVDDGSKFRKEISRAKRKPLTATWVGEDPAGIAGIARYAPSACNSQPWFVRNENGELTVYRYQKPGRSGIMPPHAARYYNRIDIGIYLCFLEICMEKEKIKFDRTLFADEGTDAELTKSAVYRPAGSDKNL